LPPTIPGVNGQRVFGKEGNSVSHPADPLFRCLQKLMGDHAPGKSDVLTAADGLDRDEIERVRSTIDQMYSGGQFKRGNPWVSAQKQLDTARAMRSMS
jgi:uncharacterized protein with von Willebrand factor type A (vWA) domain